MLSILEEKTLVELCRIKNRHAQKALFETYSKKMLPICLRYLKNDEDSLDVMNQAFLKVFEKISQFNAEGRLESWIKKIVINTTIDFIRSSKSYKETFIYTNDFQNTNEPAEEIDLFPENEEDVEFTKEELLDMIAKLPKASRIVFNLFVMDEFSHHQIGEKLKISTGTSKWHLSNARSLLKEKIKQAEIIKSKKVKHGQ